MISMPGPCSCSGVYKYWVFYRIVAAAEECLPEAGNVMYVWGYLEFGKILPEIAAVDSRGDGGFV